MSDLEKMHNDDDRKINSALNMLSEHFDSIHIFATRHEKGIADGTVTIQKGSGNWYARFGQISEWVEQEKEESRLRVKRPEY